MTTALVNGRVLPDDGFVDGRAVLLEGGRIVDVVARAPTRAADARSGAICDGKLLLPGFIDTQVNGGGGVLFNDEPSVEAIREHRRGASPLRHDRLPADADQRRSRRRGARPCAPCATRSKSGVPGVLGIHIEGPFLNDDAQGRARRGEVARARRGRASGC